MSLACTSAGWADAALTEDGALSAYGDLRLRLESDFDGENARGADVQDRTRARVRARTGLRYRPDETVTFDVRLRTGDSQSHQSPHITVYDFDENPRGNADVDLDQWYVGTKRNGFWAWAGRNGFPFKEAVSEAVFWDSDATLPGVAAGLSLPVRSLGGTVEASAGYFALPVGMQRFSGNLAAGEAGYSHRLDGVKLTLGGGLFRFLPDADDGDARRLLNGNGLRDYLIWTVSAKAEWEMDGIPFLARAEWFHNAEDYRASDPDRFTARHRDDRDGAALWLQAGNTEKRGDWLAAYSYAYVETLAINASYAQDDWVRWGGGGETRASDMQGHQLQLGYAVTDNVNVLARLFLMEAITTEESSQRFRMDLNYKF